MYRRALFPSSGELNAGLGFFSPIQDNKSKPAAFLSRGAYPSLSVNAFLSCL